MATQVEPIRGRKPPPDSAETFLIAIVGSLLFHLALAVGIYYAGLHSPPPVKKAEHEEYVVHLVDPGPQAAAPKKISPPQKKTVAKSDKMAEIPKKKMVTPKEIAPVQKKTITKKLEDAPQKTTKTVETVEKEAKPAKIVRQTKTGGTIEIKNFPYEWYLQILESKIYTAWDTLSVDYFPEEKVETTVYFQIGRQGDIKGIKVEKESYFKAIDQAAVKAVRQAAPFPELPPGYKEDVLEVHFGFVVHPRDN